MTQTRRNPAAWANADRASGMFRLVTQQSEVSPSPLQLQAAYLSRRLGVVEPATVAALASIVFNAGLRDDKRLAQPDASSSRLARMRSCRLFGTGQALHQCRIIAGRPPTFGANGIRDARHGPAWRREYSHQTNVQRRECSRPFQHQ